MAKPTRQSTHPISMLQKMMRLKLQVSRLAVICGMVSRLIASTMPTMRRVFVSHDRYFIKEIATGILDFQADKVQYYLCTYEEYLEQKQKEAQGLIGGNKTNAAGNSGKSRNVAGEAADNRNISQVGSQSNPPTLSDVFDKKTYYNPGKIISRLKQQLVKYEKMLGESEERLAELQMQQMDTALATDYEKLTELEQAIACLPAARPPRAPAYGCPD